LLYVIRYLNAYALHLYDLISKLIAKRLILPKGGEMTKCPKCSCNIQPEDVECSHCGTDVVYLKEKLAQKEAETVAKQTQKEHVRDRFKITGEIVRRTPQGIGVRFKTISQVQEELIQNLVKQVEKFKKQ
jgi:uncharacterized membrane protein YvbJ